MTADAADKVELRHSVGGGDGWLREACEVSDRWLGEVDDRREAGDRWLVGARLGGVMMTGLVGLSSSVGSGISVGLLGGGC